MPTVFITLTEPVIARYIVFSPFWEALRAHSADVHLVIVASSEVADSCQPLQASDLTVVRMEPKATSGLGLLLESLMRNGLGCKTTLWRQMLAYERGKSSYLATRAKRFLTRLIGNSVKFKAALRFAYVRTVRDDEIYQLFARYKPDLVVALSLTEDLDVAVERTARQWKVPIIGMTRSWDNFTTKGVLRVLPDVLLLQNVFLKQMALIHQGLKEGHPRMRVIGTPHYDWNQRSEIRVAREDFFSSQGLDPNRRYILYGALGNLLFPAEGGIAAVFSRLIDDGDITEPAQLLFRAHPAHTSPLTMIQSFRHVRVDAGGKPLAGAQGIRQDLSLTAHLINSVAHADVVVTTGTTFAIDACVLDRPVVCVAFDPTDEPVRYWRSIQRVYDCSDHFEALVATGGVRVARNERELAEHINAYLAKPQLDAEGRRRIVCSFAGPQDGRAGVRMAEAVIDAAGDLVPGKPLFGKQRTSVFN